MIVRLLFSLVLGFYTTPVLAATTLSENDIRILKLAAQAGGSYAGSVSVLPTSPKTGTIVLVTDDLAVGDCASAGGTSYSLCLWNGTAWVSLMGTTSVASWPSQDAGDVTFANSLANAVCIGSGTVPVCIYEDTTYGPIVRPLTDTNGRAFVWTNKTWSMFDVEGNKDVFIVDPDASGTGSGTLTMQTSEQFVASNLGIKFNQSDTNPTCASGDYIIFADTSEGIFVYCNNGITYRLAQEVVIRKTANETINNSATLQNDDELVFAAAANTTYAIKLFVIYDAAQAADFQYTFTLPASATGYKSTTNTITTTTTCSGTSGSLVFNDITTTNNNVGAAGVGSTCTVMIDGTVIIAGTAGNVQFKWAQAVADASNATVQANSWLSYRRLP